MSNNLNRLIFLMFLATGLTVFFYVPWRLTKIPLVAIIGIGLVSVLVLIAYAIFQPFERVAKRKSNNCNVQLFWVIAIGVFLRVAWVIIVPPVQISDFLSYWHAAKQIVETGAYFFSHGDQVMYAWRPPGYPLFLAICIFIAGPNPWIPPVTNVIFYILTCLIVVSIVRRLISNETGVLAALFLALWPSYIGITGLAGSEPISIFLYVAILWAFLKAVPDSWPYAVLAGILIGLGALVKPSLLLLPGVWVLFLIMNGQEYRVFIRQTVLVVLAMVLVIAPWTIRNYLIFEKLVPISTNGGSVFYRANNPLADGGWTPRGEKNLDVFTDDEVAWNRIGFAWGMEWIRENPFDFLKLVIKKQGRFLGSDNTGAYWAIWRGQNYSEFFYWTWLGLSNIWWVGIWVLTIIGIIRSRSFFTNDPRGGLLLCMVLYLVAVHSVFESQDRYHLPFIGILAILASLYKTFFIRMEGFPSYNKNPNEPLTQ